MKLFSKPLAILILLTFAAPLLFADEWNQFRGSRASGLDTSGPTPTTWNTETGKNVLWKASIPGLAHSAPIIWDDRIYITTAVGPGNSELKVGLYGDIGAAEDSGHHEWRLLAFNRKTGDPIFDSLAHEGIPRSLRHTKGTHCNSTPATDGEHIVTIFGSEGLFCFDMNGTVVWKKDLGEMDSGYFKMPTAQWGFASSPIIHDGNVIVQCDVQKDAYLAVFNLKTGEEMWRTARSDVPTWSTPAVIEFSGNTQILVNGWRHTGAYDFHTGKEIWKLDGGGDIPVPTPIIGDGLAYFTSAHGVFRPMRAIRFEARGDITPPDIQETNDSIAWVHFRKGNYMQTPILIGDNLYGCDDRGTFTCFDAKTGKIHFSERLPGGGFTASTVSDGNTIYITSETGKIWLVEADTKYTEIATNELGDNCLATPAIANGTLYFRSQHSLIAIGEN
jgi:outer membrane protein assembly factor BamB